MFLEFLECGGRFNWRLKKNNKVHANKLKKNGKLLQQGNIIVV